MVRQLNQPMARSSTHRPPSPARSSTSSRRTACSSTASSSTATARRSRRSARPPRRCSPRSPRPTRPTSTAPSRPPAAPTPGSGRGCPAPSAAKYLFRIARIIQERGRELAVLESIDNGKPIKESRDVDIPTAAAHFFYYAGWADKLEYAGFGADPQPLGVAGQVIPWNFPLLMLAWKIAPALACGNTVVLKPAETTPLTALLFAEICQQADLPPGVVNIITGAGETGRALVAHPDVDKVAFTGSTDVGRAIAKSVAGQPQEGHPRARRQGRQHRLRRRAGRPGRRGHRQRHLLQPGPRLLRRLPAAGAGVGGRRGARAAQAPDGHAARRRPARQEHRHRRDQLRRAARQDPRALRHRRGRGRRPLVAAVRAARPRLLVPADDLHRRQPGPPDRPRGDLRPGAVGADLPHAEGGGREGQQHAVRPLRRHLDRQGLADPVDGRPAARRRGLGQHVQPVRPGRPFGGYKESGYGREGGRHGLEGYLAD